MREQRQLDAYRLEHGLTMKGLSAAMAEKQVTISARTLHYFLKRMPADGRATDVTLYKVRKFLQSIPEPERRRLTRTVSKVAKGT